MTNLRDACILDGLSAAYDTEPWIRALSYACKKMQERIFTFTDRLNIWCAIENCSDEILDALAIEMRVIAYNESLSHAKKVELIKNSFIQWSEAGTTKSLEDIAAIIFENASIVEWYEYGGKPSHFKIQTTNPSVTGSELEKLKEVVKDYKRLGTTLDEVEIITSIEPQMQILGMALIIGEVETLPQMFEK